MCDCVCDGKTNFISPPHPPALLVVGHVLGHALPANSVGPGFKPTAHPNGTRLIAEQKLAMG